MGNKNEDNKILRCINMCKLDYFKGAGQRSRGLRWREKERNGNHPAREKKKKDASAPRLLMAVSRQGQSTTEPGCF